MAKTILSTTQSNSNTGITTAGATQFWFLGIAPSEPNSTESNRHITWRSPGILSKLYVRVTACSTSASSTVTIRKNGADTALTVTIPSGAGGVGTFEDTSDTVTVAAGDELCYETISGGTGTFTFSVISCIFDATTNCVTRWVSKGYAPVHASSSNYIHAVGDRGGSTGTESSSESTQKTAGTLKNWFVNVSANARTTNTIIVLRKNRASTALTVTYGSGATGILEETASSVSIAVDDEVGIAITTLVGTQAITIQNTAVDFETTTDNGVINSGTLGGSAITTVLEPVSNYFPLGGGVRNAIATEAEMQQKAREAFTFKNMVIRVPTNGITGATTFDFRVNAASAGPTISIGSSATGFLSDTTNTTTVAVNDLVNYRIVTPSIALTPNLTMQQISITTEAPAGGAAIERALTTETISTSESIAELAAKIRTGGTQTVVIAESRARLKGGVRSIATQTTVLSEAVIRVKGKVKSLTTETIIVTGGTIARLLAKTRIGGSDTTTISEIRQRLGSKSRPLSTQSVALSESSQRIKGVIKTLATQIITIGAGSIARLSSKIRATSLQTVILSDNRTRLKSSLRPLATQSIAINEARTRLKAASRTISQTITLSESINRLSAKLRIMAAQTIVIADSVARQIIGGAVEITRVLSDTVVLSHFVTRRLSVQRLLFDTISKAETLVRVKGKAKLISQTITVGEQAARIKSSLRVLSQTITTSDSINRLNALRRILTQTVFSAENVVQETIGNLVRSLVETVTASDSIVRRTAKLVILAQTIILVEQAQRLSTKLRTIPAQTISLNDSATAEINIIIKHAVRIAGDIITVGEYLQAYVIRVKDRFRKIIQPSIRGMGSNNPGYFMDTGGYFKQLHEDRY